jgi:hypothetical protein
VFPGFLAIVDIQVILDFLVIQDFQVQVGLALLLDSLVIQVLLDLLDHKVLLAHKGQVLKV